ncbi:SDR family oxidoreductase [Agathobaculum butyriciproducens]|uniref:SDR family oxidoreductase n=1 Tax=Agathobaculum butyriciproducens TaxID=1628085 RepID=A0AAW4VYN4_9FIRM|nr:SDR family oxidoreductase [Agathobaculum butyriciproducens]
MHSIRWRSFGVPAADIPLRRTATPEEVAHAVCFLASEQAAYLTGVTLDVTADSLCGKAA